MRLGTVLKVPTPHCPHSLLPAAYTAPLQSSARTWARPTATETMVRWPACLALRGSDVAAVAVAADAPAGAGVDDGVAAAAALVPVGMGPSSAAGSRTDDGKLTGVPECGVAADPTDFETLSAREVRGGLDEAINDLSSAACSASCEGCTAIACESAGVSSAATLASASAGDGDGAAVDVTDCAHVSTVSTDGRGANDDVNGGCSSGWDVPLEGGR